MNDTVKSFDRPLDKLDSLCYKGRLFYLLLVQEGIVDNERKKKS